MPAGDLVPHPGNWRTHPDGQRKAFSALLNEVGFAGAVLARELEDGQLQVIDGHLRQDEIANADPEFEVPVLVLDVDAAEADKLLLTYDPIGGMAGADADALKAILLEVATDDDDLQALFDQLAEENDINLDDDADDAGDDAQGDVTAEPETFEVIVRCSDEQQQKAVYEELSGEGLDCRLITA